MLRWEKKELDQIRQGRHRARTDLIWLCKEVLNFPDVNYRVHGPMVERLVQFGDYQGEDRLEINNGVLKAEYIPTNRDPAELLTPEKHKRRLILDARSWFKCLRITDERYVRRVDGAYVSPKELRVGDELPTANPNFSLGSCHITAIEEQPPQKVMRVNFRSGRSIEVSANHPVLQVDGWKEAGKLEPGDRCALLGLAHEPAGASYLPESEITGWMLGDGSFAGQTVTQDSEEFRAQIINAAQRAGGTAHEVHFKDRTSAVRVQGLRPLFRDLGLLETRSGDKFVPDHFFRADNKSVSELLYGLFMSDGASLENKVRYTSKSRTLCRDIQRLLLRFNIFSKIVKTFNKKYKRYYYHLEVTGTGEIQKLFDVFPWEKRNSFVPSKNLRSNLNTVPKAWRERYNKYFFKRGEKPANLATSSLSKYDVSKPKLAKLGEALNDTVLLNLSKDNIYWDFVESVEELGEEPTLAIETTTETYAVDDIVTHNTSVNCVAHSVQINLNLPDIYMAIIHAKENIAANIVGDTIKPNYVNNLKFRWLFPEFCSPWNPRKGGYENLGNTFKFTTPARTIPSRFPTFTALGANSALASLHYQWMKFTDVVNEVNSQNPEQLEKVTKMFLMAENLLVDPRYFIDVEGTCYNFADLYNEKIIEAQENTPLAEREYKVFCRGVFKRRGPDDEKERFQPEERDWPFVIQCPDHPQEEGKGLQHEECGICGKKLLPVSRWPERWSVEELLKRRKKDPKMFADQQLNAPNAAGDEGKTFNVARMIWVPEKDIQRIPFKYYSMAVDLAETTGKRSDFTAMSVLGWDQAGRGYMVDGVLDKWLPDDTIDMIWRLYFKWKCRFCRIEESSFTRGLEPALNKKSQEEGKSINFDWLKRDNDTTKKERINSLQPFFASGTLRFNAGLNPFVQDQLKKQFDRHPAGRDDMLDCLADQFQGKQDFARTVPNKAEQEVQQHMKLLLWDREEWKRRYQGETENNQSPLGVL